MYIPLLFRENNMTTLHAFIQEYPFATMVSHANSQCHVTHLPLLLDAQKGDFGSLYGHMARDNQQWQCLTDSTEVVAIFQGPHAYVSPSWYSVAPSVPTWNYASVQAYGHIQIIDDPGRVHNMLTDLVAFHENQFTIPWVMDLPPDYQEKMLRNIISFEMTLTRLEGNFKLSQNRTIEDQHHVITHLLNSNNARDHETGRLMQQRLEQANK